MEAAGASFSAPPRSSQACLLHGLASGEGSVSPY